MVSPDTRGATNAAQGNLMGWFCRDLCRLRRAWFSLELGCTTPTGESRARFVSEVPMTQGALRLLRCSAKSTRRSISKRSVYGSFLVIPRTPSRSTQI